MTINQTINKRKSFIIHKDSLHILKDMTNEQAGIFIKAIDFYQQNGHLPDLDFGLKMAIAPFVSQFERDEESYRKTCEARREAGSIGGKQKVANASKSKQKVANLADSDSKNDNESKNESKSDNKNELENNFERIYKLYNSDKKIKVIPFDKLKNQFKAALSKVSITELEENVLAYLAYLKTALWRKKKDFAAWINSSEFYANDWLAEIKRENNQIATQAKPISAADEWKSIIDKMDQQNNKQIK